LSLLFKIGSELQDRMSQGWAGQLDLFFNDN
jgi:hypothetical protein